MTKLVINHLTLHFTSTNTSAESDDINPLIVVKDSKGNVIAKNNDGSYTVPEGEKNLKVEVQTQNDDNFEGNEVFELNGKTEFMTSDSKGTGTIKDDGSLSTGPADDDRGITVSGLDDVSEGSNSIFTVTLPNGNTNGTEISLALSDNTTESDDYNSTFTAYYYNNANEQVSLTITAGKITLPANVTTFYVKVPTTDDSTYEGAETFKLTATITNGNSANDTSTILDDGTGKVYDDKGIDTNGTADNDRGITVSGLDDVSEGSNSIFTVTLPNGNTNGTEISLALSDNTTESDDYNSTFTAYYYNNANEQVSLTITAGKITLPANVTTFYVKVPTTDDSTYEGAETFKLTATITNGNSANDTSTILDDGTGKVYDDKGIDTNGTADNDIPTTTNDTITTNEDTIFTFAMSDFGTQTANGVTISKVKILTLPTDGKIQLDGLDISENAEISVSDITFNKLKFVPTSQTDADSSFTFQVGNGTIFSNTQTVTVNITAVADTPTTILSVGSNTGLYVDSSTNIVTTTSTSNTTLIQDLSSSVKTGLTYSMSFNYLDNHSTDSVAGQVKVYWGGVEVATVNGDKTISQTLTLDLVGGSGDGYNILEFRDTSFTNNASPVDGMNINTIYMAPSQNMLEYNVALSAALNTADRTDASETLSIKLSGYVTGTTFSIGYAETSSQFDVVLNANTMQPTGNWIIPLSAITDDTFANSGIKMYVPESAGTFTLTSTAIAIEANDSSTATATAGTANNVVDFSLNVAPTSTNDTITPIEDTTYTFTVNDFGTYADDGGVNTFTSIMISSLPTSGTIRLLGHDKFGSEADVHIGDEILKTDLTLGNLIYIPAANLPNLADSTYNFDFKVSDGRMYSDNSYTTTIDITAVADMPTISVDIGIPTDSGSTSLQDDFSINLNGWSGGTSLSSNQMLITYSVKASKEYIFDSSLNGTTVNVTFTVRATGDVEGRGEGSNVDSLEITMNGGTKDVYIPDEWTANDGDVTTTYTTTAQIVNGKVIIDLKSTASSSGENIYIDAISVSTGTGVSTKDYPITITNSLGVDKDGSESLSSVTLSGIPTNATLFANGTAVTVSSGSVILTQSQITTGNIILKIPSTDNQAFSLTASVTSTESSNSSSKTATAFDEHVTADTTPVTTVEVANLVTTSSAGTGSSTNIVVIMDVSGSMSTDDGTGKRLDLAKTAINSMINSYVTLAGQDGTVNVNLTSFQATATSYGWQSATDAKSDITLLSAGGYTNYEDAVYKTYTNYTDIPGAKTIVLFVSDGEPTRENLEGRDVSGNIGLDAENGWLDSTYKTAWQTFINTYADELKVVGIGKGLTNTTYLEQLAQGISSAVLTDVVHLQNTADLATYVAPNVDSITGNVFSNIDYKADGAGGIKSIVINGITYDSNNSTEVTALSNGVNTKSTGEYGKLTFNFTTGDYSYTTATATSVDRSESFAITVADADGDTSSFNLNVQVFSSSTEYTYASTTYDAGTGFDSLVLGTAINIDFDSVANIDNFEQIDLTKNGNHALSNIELQDVLDITDSNELLSILGDSGDTVSLKNTTSTTNVWSKSGTTDTNGFDTYVNSGNNAVSLKIDKDISISII